MSNLPKPEQVIYTEEQLKSYHLGHKAGVAHHKQATEHLRVKIKELQARINELEAKTQPQAQENIKQSKLTTYERKCFNDWKNV